MFETFMESRSGARRRAGGTVLSMLVHAMVVAGAVQATERVVTSAGLARSDTLKFVLARPERAATEVQDEAPLPGAPEVVSEVALPEMTPVGIPQVDLGARPFDAATVVGRQTTVGMTDVAGEKEQTSGVARVFASAEVDDPAVAISQPAPRYPVEFERAGVSGYVDLEYVIDATGHAEPGSVRVVSASHAAFIEPAREAILGGVYRPARNRGIVVRQLVRQRVVFS